MTDPSQHDRILGYPSPNERQPKPPLPRRTRVTITVLYFLGAIGLAMYGLVTPEIRHSSPAQSLPRIEVLRPEWCVAKTIAAIVGVLLFCIASGMMAVNKRIVLGTVLALAFFAVGIWSVVNGFHFASVAVRNQIIGADGATYCCVDTSFEKGHELAIGHLVSSGPLYQTVDLLATASLGHSPYLTVLRPAVADSGRGAIYSTFDGHIAACFDSNYEDFSCYLVFDTTTGRLGDLQTLSPFQLLNATSSIDVTDEAAVLTSLSGVKSLNRMIPTEQTLNDALTHPNSKVRASAAGMLKTLKPNSK